MSTSPISTGPLGTGPLGTGPLGTGPISRTRQAPSLADVAALAGVSSQTVSRVSTGAQNVRPSTRDRVLRAMEELGYSPNGAARALRYGSFGTIGLIAHRLARVGEAFTVEGVVEAARDEGYAVKLVELVSPTSEGVLAAAARMSQQAIDGLIIIRAEASIPYNLALPPTLPVVVSDSRFLDSGLPTVAADQVAGTRQAVDYLLSLGHRTVHHVAGPADSNPARDREETWRATVEAAGRPVPPVRRGDWSALSGYQIGQALCSDPTMTAVFCANDEMAFGLMRALHEAGRRVPEEISVVGFDNVPLAAYLWPPLTTVSQDFHTIGRKLIDLLLEQMREGEGAPSSDGGRVLVPTELIVRASTGTPPESRR